MLPKIKDMNSRVDAKLRELTGKGTVDWLLLVFLIFIFCITMIRAAITQVTYDEAQTYLQYCSPDIFKFNGMKEIYWNSYANNHLLNTYLITISELLFRQKYSEFLIRLPQLLFYLIFLISIWVLYRRKFLSSYSVIFLTANYYVSEFYGLARGYAMANTLVFLACVFLVYWKRSFYEADRYLILCSVMLGLAVFANTIVFLIVPSFCIIWLVRLWQNGRLVKVIRKYFIYLIIWFCFLLVMIKYHMNVIAYTTPAGVYTGREKGFFECFFAGYGDMYTRNIYLKNILGVLFLMLMIVLLSALLYLKRLKECDLMISMVIFIAVYVAAQLIFEVGYPVGRELIPFWAFIVMALREGVICIINNISPEKINIRVLRSGAMTVCLMLVFIFARRIDVTSTTEWNHEYGLREHIIKQYMACNGDESGFDQIKSMTMSEWFYMWKLDDIKFSPTPFD